MVCVDFDGTILNFNQCIKDFLAKDNITFVPENIKFYDYSNEGIGCTKEQVYNAFYQPEFYDILQPFEGAIEALDKLKAVEDVYAYTGAVHIPDIKAKRHNLIKTLGLKGHPYTSPNTKLYNEELPLLKGASSKPVVLEADAVFDDCLGILYNWYQRGSSAKLYLIDAPYNQESLDTDGVVDWSKIIRCSSFVEAVDMYINSL